MLRRAAFSPNIKERADCSAALFTADGELLVQAEHIPVHLGSMPASVRGGDRRVRRRRSSPGDQVVLNDPFAGGTHLNDITLVAPVLRRRRPPRRLGRQPGPPRRRRRRGARARCRPTPPRSSRRACASRRCGSPPRCGRSCSRQLAHAGRAARATSTPRSAPTWSAWRRLAALRRRAARRGPRLRRAAHAGRARPRCPTARGPSRTCSTRSARRPTSSSRRPSGSPCTIDGDARRRSTSPAPTRSGAGNVNAVEAVTVSAVAFALRSALDPTIPANGGALRPVTVVAPAGHGRRRPAAGRGGRRQRRGEPAGRRRLPRRAGRRPCPTGSARRRRGR